MSKVEIKFDNSPLDAGRPFENTLAYQAQLAPARPEEHKTANNENVGSLGLATDPFTVDSIGAAKRIVALGQTLSRQTPSKETEPESPEVLSST